VDKRAYWRGKLPQLVAQGKTSAALEALDRFWPASDLPARVATLLAVWPERLAHELPDPVPAPVAEALAAAPLALDDPAWDALLATPAVAPLAADLRAARAALGHLAAGDSAAAREALSPIGLRSPLRHTRMMVRALAELLDGQDDNARRALATLSASPLAGLAARVTAALDGADRDFAQRLALAGGHHELAHAVEPLTEGRALEGLARLSRCVATQPPRVVRALRRDLPAALLAQEVDPDAILRRVRRALGSDPDDPEDLRTRALLEERTGCMHCAAEQWLDLADDIRRGEAYRGLDPVRATAALNTRAARDFLEHSRSERESPWGLFGAADYRTDARRLLEEAIAIDPERRDAWTALRETLESLRDRSALIALSERFAAAFPDDPDAQLRAAEDCARRRSFVKAKKHVERAAELAPHDPRIRDVEADILLGRGLKQLKSGHRDRGLATLRDAAGLTDTSADARLRVRALLAVAEASLDEPGGHERLAGGGPPLGVDPWIWAARCRLAVGRLGRDGGVSDAFVPAAPKVPPRPDEITAVLTLCDDAHDDGEFHPVLADLAMEVAAHGTVLTDEDALHQAVRWCGKGEAALRLAEHADACFPGGFHFTFRRYHLALTHDRPRDYFESAVPKLEALVAVARARLLERLPDPLRDDPVAIQAVEKSLADWGAPVNVLSRVLERLNQLPDLGPQDQEPVAKR